MNNVDYDKDYADVVNGIPTAKDQNGFTLTESELNGTNNG